jgi:multidrug efflux pump subunit AcrB/outer membrane protein TolC
MKRKIHFVESCMKHRQIVFLAITLLVILGFYALKNMPRQEFPVVTIRQGLVIGVYPGATSAQVADQLTTEVERYLFSFKEIKKKKTYSYSRDGMMIIFVELDDNVKNSEEVWSKLNHGLNNLKQRLPAGVVSLFANNDFGDTSALLITLQADNKSYRELETWMNRLEDRLRRIESVSKLRHYGLQKEQITIYLEKNKLEKYGINPSTLMLTLFSQGFSAAGGSIENGSMEMPIHVSSLYKNEKDIEEQIIYSDPAGNLIRLKDVSTVFREYPEPESFITNNGKKCLLISMEMLPGNNIVQYGKDVDKELSEFRQELPPGITIERIADLPKVVGDSVDSFLMDLLYAILAVVLVTMILLPFRVSSVAASSIPITIFISLGILYLVGIELNTVTLAALIVVLGMIVDNSIVIVDNYMEKLDHGMTRWNASVASAKVYFKAIFSATLAISITFFPFLFTLKGMFRDFVMMFPWTVTITLGISLLVAMMVIPFLQFFFIRTGFVQNEQDKKFNFLRTVQQVYEKALNRAFRHPSLTLILGVLSVIGGVVLFLQVPQRLLPVAERNQFAVEIYLPQGSSLKCTAAVCDSLEFLLKQDKRITSVTSFVGTSSPRFHTTYAPNIPGKNYAQFIVNTTSSGATVDLLNEYSAKYANRFTNATVRFKQLDYQAVPAPVEVRISGDSTAELKPLGDSLVAQLSRMKGISWVRTDYNGMLPVYRVDLDRVAANRLGIDRTLVATNLAARFSGIPVTTIWENNYPVTVRLKTVSENNESVEDIRNEYIRSLIPTISIPLRQIATVNPDWQQGQIVRRNGMPTITVLADIQRGMNINQVFSGVETTVEKMKLPAGVQVTYGGAKESDEEHLPQIIRGLLISICIIFLILVFHFKKINLALLVLGSASLSLLGASFGLLALHMEFGLTSVLGIISLIGILVRNGIIMLDYAEELRANQGMTVKEAAIEAGRRRMRPIFLTSAAASMGVIPMIIGNSGLWSPMGTVICFGTLTSMVLLVIMLPVAYWKIFQRADRMHESAKPGTKGLPVKTALASLLLLGMMIPAGAQNVYTLDQCKKLSLEHNNQVKNAMLEVSASDQVRKSAITRFFPTISATASVFRLHDNLFDLKIPGGNLPVYDGNPINLIHPTQFAYFPGMSFSMFDRGTVGALSAFQPVFAGGRILYGNQLAKLGTEVSTAQLSLARNEVLLKTEEQYWQIVSLDEKLKTTGLYEQFLDTLYKEVNDAWHDGLITHNDLLKVSIKQNEIRMNKMKLENGRRLAVMAFCQHIGVPCDTLMKPGDTATPLLSADHYRVDPDKALPERIEYQLLQKSLDAERLKTKIKRGEYLPQAGIDVSALYYNVDVSPNRTTNGLVLGSISIPVSAWWEASHTLKERKIREQIVHNDADNASQLMVLQMQKAWNDLEEMQKQVALSYETMIQAKENMRESYDHYKGGVIPLSDLLEARALMQHSLDELTDSKTNCRVKLVAYMQATGRYQQP